MFNYNKELIVNDLKNVIVLNDSAENPIGFTIKRGAEYKLANVLGGKIYKTKGNEGKCGKAELDVTKLLPTVDYHQILVFIKTPSKELADYGMANWHEFGKPILVETAAHSAEGVAAALNLALPYDNPLYKASVEGGKVVIELAEPWMAFHEIRIFGHEPKAWNPDFMRELDPTDNGVTITPNVEEFATAKWIVENLRFPSYPNVRYGRLYADESPVAGTVYTQYAFEYVTERPVPGGLSAVGQKVDSVTGHVIFVPSALESDFEAILNETGFSVEEKAEEGALADNNNMKVLEVSE